MSNILPLFPSQTLPNTYEEAAEAAAAAAAAPGARSYSGGARINNAHARTREKSGEELNNYASNPLRQIARYYCDVFGRRSCAPSILRQIAEALDAGMNPATVVLCIDAAAEAETPSWAYAAAVIRGCLKEGALTPEAFRQRSERHRAARSRRGNQGGGDYQRPVPHSMNYPQRNYSPQEVAELEAVLFRRQNEGDYND